MEAIARIFLGGLRKFPLATVQKWGKTLGVLAYYFARSRRRIALENLDLVYGTTLTPSEKVAIAKSSFVNLITMALEFCYSPALERPVDNVFKITNPEMFLNTYSQERGIILLVPHMGNWDIPSRWFYEHGFTTKAITRRQKQEWVTRIVSEIREANGFQEIDKKNALRPALTALRNGEILVMLIDQHARKDAVEVEFLGHPAATVASIPLLVMRTGCDVMIAYSFRYPDGSLGGGFSEPLETISTGDRKRDILENTQLYIAALEVYVREHPQDWLWMHDRWKTLRKKKVLASTAEEADPMASAGPS